MTHVPAALREVFLELGGAKLQMLTGGTGSPVLVLHGGEGTKGWLPVLETLARRHTVYFPSHPGYYQSERPAWLLSVPDMARFYLWLIDSLGLPQVQVVGHSLGGWLAAEMAVCCHHAIRRLLLVDAAGLKPQHTPLLDVFATPPEGIRTLAFHDPAQIPDFDRLFGPPQSAETQAMAARNGETLHMLLRQPGYLHPPALQALLPGIQVPTRILWGCQDRIIPLECGEHYARAIAGAELCVIDACGHRPQVEKPDAFLALAGDFLA